MDKLKQYKHLDRNKLPSEKTKQLELPYIFFSNRSSCNYSDAECSTLLSSTIFQSIYMQITIFTLYSIPIYK